MSKIEWKKEGYLIVKGGISKDIVRILECELRATKALKHVLFGVPLKNKKAFNDKDVPNSFSAYGLLGLESFQTTVLQKLIEKRVGLKLLPTFSYARIYYKGASLPIHVDRPQCAVSASICLGPVGTKWPLGLVTRCGRKIRIIQKPGDMLIYSGCELKHWRDKLPAPEHIQAFFHFVPDIKANKHLLYDGRAMIGLPERENYRIDRVKP